MRLINNLSLKIILFSLFIIVFISCKQEVVTINIIETSDVHGAIFPYDLVKNCRSNGSLSQVYQYVNDKRAEKDNQVILVDNGDMLQGSPVAYYSNFAKQKENHFFADVMNFMAYDVATVGNHDIEPGHAVYDKFNDEINFPWLAANAIDITNDSCYFKPFSIVNRGGVKVAFLGLITPAVPNWFSPEIYEGIRFDDMIESATFWVSEIKEKENPDVIVGLFHSGVDYTYGDESAETYKNENASQLIAEKVIGFDLILVGHDHMGWNKYVSNSKGDSVLIAGTTSKARDIVDVEITLIKDNGGRFRVQKTIAAIVSMKNIEPSPEFMNKFDKNFLIVKGFVSLEIGRFTEPMYASEALFGESASVDLIHKIQLEYTQADISFSASLSFADTIKSGVFTVADLFKLYRFDNLLYTIEMTGQEIDEYLEYSYSTWFNKMKNEDDHLLKFVVDSKSNLIISENGKAKLSQPYYNFDSAAGIVYTVDISKSQGQIIEIESFVNGEEFNLAQTYTVAVNSYRGNGGGGHLTVGAKISKSDIKNRIIKVSNNDIRWYIMDWIKKNKVINPSKLNNQKIVPAGWWKKAKERDLNLLL